MILHAPKPLQAFVSRLLHVKTDLNSNECVCGRTWSIDRMFFGLYLHTNPFTPWQSSLFVTLTLLFPLQQVLPPCCSNLFFNLLHSLTALSCGLPRQDFQICFPGSFSPPLSPLSPSISGSVSCREFSKEREKAKARGDFQKLREKQQLEEDLKVSGLKSILG